MRTIANWEDVPIFDSEKAEADFWTETRPDLRLMESAVSGTVEVSESVTITIRIDPRMLARIKRLARSRFSPMGPHRVPRLYPRADADRAGRGRPVRHGQADRMR